MTNPIMKHLIVQDSHSVISHPALNKEMFEEEIIPSQMEVAPLHCTVDITQKRRLFKNTKETEKM